VDDLGLHQRKNDQHHTEQNNHPAVKGCLKDMLVLVPLKSPENQNRGGETPQEQHNEVIVNGAAMTCILSCQ